ncbi:MAG: hypothetical protein E6G67_11320, partial [Actinobacteria bacterium]
MRRADFHLSRLATNVFRREPPVAERIKLSLVLEPLERKLAAGRRAQALGQKQGQRSLPVRCPLLGERPLARG